MLYRILCSVLLGQLASHDEALRHVVARVKARQEMGVAVMGALIFGLGAFIASAGGAPLDGSAMAPEAIFATWLVILCGASGIAWVMASLLLSIGAKSGHGIVQPISYENFGKDGDVDPTKLDGCSTIPDEEFYRALAGSCVRSLYSREREAKKISKRASRSQAALFVGIAAAGIGAVAAFVALGGLWA